jgi:hypothetical protein
MEGIYGLTVAGGGIVSERQISGVSVTLGDLRTEGAIAGVSIAGYRIKAPAVTGIHLCLVTTQVGTASGFVTGAYNRFTVRQVGLSVGLVNHASELFGVQIGLLNIAENNPPLLRFLPLLNAHF